MEKFPQSQPESKPPRVEKISELSPEYGANRYGTEYFHDKEHDLKDCFGNFTFDMIKHIKDKALPIEEQLSEYSHTALREHLRPSLERQSITQDEAEAGVHKVILENIEQFRKLMLHKDYALATSNFINEAAQNPEIITALRQEKESVSKSTIRRYKKIRVQDPMSRWVYHVFGSNPSVDSLTALVGAKKISDELWLKILENHKTNFEKRLKEFQEQELPILSEQFKTTIEAAIDHGELPLSKELVKNRMGQTHVTLKDGLYAALERIGGRFDLETNVASIDSSTRKKGKEHIFFHEMFHVLSGRSIVKQNEELTGAGEIQHERVGLLFTIKREGYKKRQKFHWLNEAVTSHLEGKYVPPPEKDSKVSYLTYGKERELLQLVMANGKIPIDEKFFIDAYFENLDPTLPSENRLPAWKALSQQIELSWGAGFLNRVEVMIKKVGIAETCLAITSGILK